MNCLLCEDKLLVCETCEAPWPAVRTTAPACRARNATRRRCSRLGTYRLHIRRSASDTEPLIAELRRTSAQELMRFATEQLICSSFR